MRSYNKSDFLARQVIGLVLKIATVYMPLGVGAQGLYLSPGVHMIANGNPDLVLNNAGLVSNGSFAAGRSTVIFTGNIATASSAIGGTNPVSFYNVIVRKSFNDVQLNNNAAVAGIITMDSGNLQLNNYVLDLGSSGMVMGERSSSCIIGAGGGVLKITVVLNGPQAVNPGNMGVELTSAANLGLTTITRGNVQQETLGGRMSIQRYFEISPAMNTDLRASLRFYYLDGELAGYNKQDLSLFSGQEGRGDWVRQGRDQASPAANWLSKDNVNALHRFTLAVGGAKPANTPMQIYPNPSHDIVMLVGSSDKEQSCQVTLYDQRGHPLESKKLLFRTGVNSFQWDINKYANGVYYLSFSDPDWSSIKIVKQ